LAVTGPDAATFPGGGEPSAVKSACCCASVLGLMGRFGLGRIIMNVLSGMRASKRSAAPTAALAWRLHRRKRTNTRWTHGLRSRTLRHLMLWVALDCSLRPTVSPRPRCCRRSQRWMSPRLPFPAGRRRIRARCHAKASVISVASLRFIGTLTPNIAQGVIERMFASAHSMAGGCASRVASRSRPTRYNRPIATSTRRMMTIKPKPPLGA
jgi:hypothetical protein